MALSSTVILRPWIRVRYVQDCRLLVLICCMRSVFDIGRSIGEGFLTNKSRNLEMFVVGLWIPLTMGLIWYSLEMWS